jgi:tetratricopeptide (TPR) repeat protein/type II secretory pathway predicted ATPase ExeA
LKGDILGTHITTPLDVAGFLDGFDITDSGEFSIWKDRQQARFLPTIKDALIVLMDRCRRTGDSRQLEQLADRMLVLDELSEDAIRAKMEARAFAGDRLKALQIFEEWKSRLDEDLRAAPSALLEGMAVRLRWRGWERTTPDHIPPVSTDQWRDHPFVGRATEYRTLYEAWEGIRSGFPGHALVLGDSGIGKTTLVGRLTTAAGLEGAAISRVQCYDLERDIPYAMLVNLIQGLLDRPGVSATSPDALSELARTVPDLRRRFPNLLPAEASQGETARIRLTEALQQLLSSIAEEQPVILVVDDVHFADDASLSLLHLVMRRARNQPIMVVFIARAGELTRSAQASRLKDSATRLGIREIIVQPMTDGESREFLTAMTGSDKPSPAVRRSLLRSAAGFPMVMELLLQDWQTNGDRSLILAVDAMTADVVTPGSLDDVYERMIGRISDTLEASARNVLSLAAILGRRLNDLSLYRLVDLDTGHTLEGLRELVSRRILRDRGNGLEFVNELVRGAAYFGVPSSLRRTLHSVVADQFIQGAHGDIESLGLEIAWHCTRADRSNEATGYLLRGARDARARGALHEAERGLSTALDNLQPPDRGTAVVLLAQVLQEQGDWAQSLELLASEGWACDRDQAIESHVLTLMARASLYGLSTHEIYEELQSLEGIVRTATATETRLLAGRVGAHLIAIVRSDGAARGLLEALTTIDQHDLSADNLALCALTKAILLYQLHDRRSCAAEIEHSAAHIRSQNLTSTTACQLQAGLGAIKCVEGEYQAGLEFLHNAYRVVMRLDNDTLRRDVGANIALAYGRLGQYQQQLEWARESMALGPTSLTSFCQVLACYSASFASAMRGNCRETLDLITAMEHRMPGTLPPWALQAWSLYAADALFLAGRHGEARRMALRATFERGCELHAPGFAGPFARWVVVMGEIEGRLADVVPIVGRMLASLQQYDALDRAEILAASRKLHIRVGRNDRSTQEALRVALASLPDAIAVQLRRLEFL